MRRILADVWQLDLRSTEAELTLATVTPAMAGLIDAATESRRAAEVSARVHGRDLVLPVAA
jgi:hypothetical protein